jgi:hypothetical protein
MRAAKRVLGLRIGLLLPSIEPRRRVAATALLLLGMVGAGPIARSEGYGDWFSYDMARLPKDVLVDTIGQALVHGESFQAFDRVGTRFVPVGELRTADTFPVGTGGYGGWVRYLVTAQDGKYFQVIVDPYAGRRTWLDLDETKSDYAIVFANLEGRQHPVEEEIDVFLLAEKTKLYAAPRSRARATMLREERSQDRVYYPIAFKGAYVQIGLRTEDPMAGTIDGGPVGWIRARDDQGRLAFHLFMYTWD